MLLCDEVILFQRDSDPGLHLLIPHSRLESHKHRLIASLTEIARRDGRCGSLTSRLFLGYNCQEIPQREEEYTPDGSFRCKGS
jgi:hypothetical protein